MILIMFIEFINVSKFLNVIGFAAYSYEGVGTVLPIMELTAHPKSYPKVLFAVLTTDLAIYLLFGELSYFVYGNALQDVPIIITELPVTPNYNLAIVSSI
jgi:hypothetical protein